MHAGSINPAAARSLGHRVAFSNQQQRLKSAIHPGVACSSQLRGQSPAIGITQPRSIASVTCVHAPNETCPAMALQDIWLPT
jgi:hypothetical protein